MTSTHITHDNPELHDRLVSDLDGRPLPYVVTWVGADDPDDSRQTTRDTAQASELDSSGQPNGERALLTKLARTRQRPAGWYLNGPSGTRVRFLTPGAAPEPELHEGAEQPRSGRVRVRCSCGLATSWQPLGALARTSLRTAWDEHAGHALSALREAVRVAAATR